MKGADLLSPERALERWLSEHLGELPRALAIDGNLAVLRSALINLKSRLCPECSWPELTERCQHNPGITTAAILKLHAK